MAQTVKNPTALQKTGFDPWVRKISWRREWLHIPEFLPGESHGQRSLVGYSPWGHKHSDTTEHAHMLQPTRGGSQHEEISSSREHVAKTGEGNVVTVTTAF